LWQEGVPDLSVLWLSEPDRSEHANAPGSETALAAIRLSDTNLANVLKVLEAKGVLSETDIMVVSDHGFSTIERSIDLAESLSKDGFTVVNKGDETLAKGVIRIAGNGGTQLFYVGQHDADATSRLVRSLQRSDFAGVIFSRTPTAGSFPLSQIHLEKEAGPDVVMSFRWNDHRNKHDLPGMILVNASSDPALGTHGTLSPFDVHNLLVARGPDFRREMVSDLPSANIDVAPTILHILGIKPPHSLDGRVLSEALVGGEKSSPVAETKLIEASCSIGSGTWRQYLRTSKLGASVYFDEGNGNYSPN
jgi:arylsulfatase A-like enzyme